MIHLITEEYEDTVAMKMTGDITKKDYDIIIPVIEDKIKRFEKINLYCEVENVSSLNPGAIWEDLKFDAKHYKSFERVAVVGAKDWLEWLSKFAKPFTTASINYYDTSQKAKAMAWVVQGKEEYEPEH